MYVLGLSSGQPSQRAAITALVVVALAGVGQKASQAISDGVLRVGEMLCDLCVDMTSGWMAAMVVHHLNQRRRVVSIC